ncbi:hypothetical protein DCC39_08145 [Pueribacillus theae]|uniref:Cytochrome c oxidase assembly factor CtaG n=1 Tax=Pueribacillus theae TaxID=2171751 RepID=A0A2U1K3P9_9BACI|nr:cytochrome c oxidase assembly protein [Pueribacillus theae]PWA12042.1 hypothetical protein DCC39_08145 [Pueribacillus theae]
MGGSLFSNYTWYEMWGPVWIAVLALLSYLYIRKIALSHQYRVAGEKVKYFFFAAILLYLAKGSPFSIIADDYMFSMHVLQLSIMLFVVTPLFILSLPTDFIRRYFWDYRMRNAIKLFAHPWMTAIFFNGLLTVYFVPSVFNTIHQSFLLTSIAQIILMFNAFLMWWTIITPLPEVSKLSDFTRTAYVFCTAMLLMPIGIFFIIIETAHYPAYEAVAGMIIPAINAIYDQQLAGGLLKAIQLTSYGIALFYLIMRWAKKEEDKEGKIDDESLRVVQGVVIHFPDKK